MASDGYIPTREADLVTWSANLATRLTGDPARYGIDIAQAATYQGLNDTFAAAYTVANEDLTRTVITIGLKDQAKDALIDGPSGIRVLVDFIQGNPNTTNEMRGELQITIRNTENTPIAAPTTKPVLTLGPCDSGFTVKFILRDELAPDRKAKPIGVMGAQVLTFIGDTPPVDLRDWSLDALITRMDGEVIFPSATAAFSKVWLAAYWVNPKGESGPTSGAVTTNLGDGLSQAA